VFVLVKKRIRAHLRAEFSLRTLRFRGNHLNEIEGRIRGRPFNKSERTGWRKNVKWVRFLVEGARSTANLKNCIGGTEIWHSCIIF
jgi:hypothetical protein